MEINRSIRNQMVVLSRRSKARTSEFAPNRPTKWNPEQVSNPNGKVDEYFTDSSAWEYIACLLENEHPVETIALDHPPGKTGYVMKSRIEPDSREIYIKLQLGSGRIIGRSFHYSEN